MSENDKKIEIQDEKTQEFYDWIIRFRTRVGAAIDQMGVRITDIGPGWAKVEMDVNEAHLNPIGSVHGGIIFFLADSAGGTAAWTRGSMVTTSNGNIHFINAAKGVSKLVAEAVEIKAGRNLLTYDVYVRSETGKLISKATLEYYNLHKEITKEMLVLKEDS